MCSCVQCTNYGLKRPHLIPAYTISSVASIACSGMGMGNVPDVIGNGPMSSRSRFVDALQPSPAATIPVVRELNTEAAAPCFAGVTNSAVDSTPALAPSAATDAMLRAHGQQHMPDTISLAPSGVTPLGASVPAEAAAGSGHMGRLVPRFPSSPPRNHLRASSVGGGSPQRGGVQTFQDLRITSMPPHSVQICLAGATIHQSNT